MSVNDEKQQKQQQKQKEQQQLLQNQQNNKINYNSNGLNNSNLNNSNTSNLNNSNGFNSNLNNNISKPLNNSNINKPVSNEQLVKELQIAKQDRDSYAKNLEDQFKKNEALEKQVFDIKNKLKQSYEENDKLSKLINEQASILNGAEKNANDFHSDTNEKNEEVEKKIISLDLSEYVEEKVDSNNTKNYLDYFSGVNENKEEKVINKSLGENTILPVGSIILFKNSEKIPENWVICDGKNSTPDLSKLFLFGENNVIMYIIKIK